MFIREITKREKGKRYAYWALVESVRTERGPRQKVVAYIGLADEPRRKGIKKAAEGNRKEEFIPLFDMEETEPEWVEIDVNHVRTENQKKFGGIWLALQIIRKLKLDEFLKKTIPTGKEEIPWAMLALVLVICRFCNPSSELHIAESYYQSTAMPELLGIPADKINDDRLYRALDKLLPCKNQLEKILKERLGTLFDIEYDLLLYDVTSTYFEGQCEMNPMARRGYSRDHRGDCKQVCIGLVVTREGIPLGYEVFPGNTADTKTYQQIIEKMESQYGQADRIWCSDRGMIGRENLEFLRQSGRKYIIGTAKASLKKHEQELLSGDWHSIRGELEVKLCPIPGSQEQFILCRSKARAEKEKAMHARFIERIESGLQKIKSNCESRIQRKEIIDRRVGKLLGENTRGAGLFSVTVEEEEVVEEKEKKKANKKTRAKISWTRNEHWQEWATLSEGCYMLRTNVMDWNSQDLWEAYIQLTEAEEAFRITKNDLEIRPVWHQTQDRVLAHIFVCFLAYVLWRTLGQMVKRSNLGDEPRRVLNSLGEIAMIDVVLPTGTGTDIRRTCVTHPTDHQTILLQKLKLSLPGRLNKNAFQNF